MLVAVAVPLAVSVPASALSRPARTASAEPKATIIDLGPADAGWVYGHAINNKGQVAGAATKNADFYKALLFSGGSVVQLHPLLAPGAITSEALDINDSGAVVGHLTERDTGEYATVSRSFLLKDGAANKIEPAGAKAINNSGQIVGTGWNNGSAWGRGWIRDPDGSVLYLAGFKGQRVDALALNNSGSVVGGAEMDPDNPKGTYRAFRARPGETIDPTRDRLEFVGESTVAFDVNDRDEVAGYGANEEGGHVPLIWNSRGRPQIMDTPHGGIVDSINNAGLAVGRMYDERGNSRAALYEGSRGTDLNTLLPDNAGWGLIQATDINDVGQVTGVGRRGGEETHAYLLQLPGYGSPVIDSISLETQNYPSDEWVGTALNGVVDGNPLRVTVSVTNPGDRPLTTRLRLVDKKSGKLLPGGEVEQDLAPHETVKAQVVLDSTGYAWKGAAAEPFEVSATLVNGDLVRDSKTKSTYMYPKPVVLVHGYKSNANTWNRYTDFMLYKRSSLKAYAVGDGQVPGTLNTGGLTSPVTLSIKENAEQEALYIEGVRRKTGAFHVDVVAHSMGGLITRQYIQTEMPASPDDKPVVNRMMQMGTPNRGSPCADMIMDIASLTHSPVPLWPATLQLSVPYMRDVFNRTITDLKGVTVSNLVGVGHGVPCFTFKDGIVDEDGDELVPESSARFTYTDIPYTRVVHTSMTESQGDFLSYVYPRLASVLVNTGNPGGVEPNAQDAAVKPTDKPTDKAVTARPAADAGEAGADDDTGTDTGGVSSFAAPSASVEAGKTVTVPLEVPEGKAFGVTGVLPPTVGLALINPAGQRKAEYAAGSEAAQQPIQGLTVAGSYAGQWKLEIVNAGTETVEAALVAWVAGNPVKVTAKAEQVAEDGRARVKATVTDGGQPVTGATVRAVLVAQDATRHELTLSDDGASGDGGAGDGVYAAETGPLADGSYGVSVKAETSKGIRTARGNLQIKQVDTSEYALTLSAQPGGSVSASPAKDAYRAGTEVTVSAVADAGRIPLGWTVDGERRPAGALKLVMDRAHTVVALFGSYTVTEIGGMPDGVPELTEVRGLNDRGQVAATVKNKKWTFRAMRWQDGVFTDLGDLGCTDSDATGNPAPCDTKAWGINEAGEVAGWAQEKVGDNIRERAVVYRGGSAVKLPQPVNDHAKAWDLNDSGQVFGWTGPYVMWDQGTAKHFPGTPEFGLGYTEAAGRINNGGVVAGAHVTSWGGLGEPTGWHPAIYRNGVVTPLEIPACKADGGIAYDVNNLGLVVGEGWCNTTDTPVTHHAYTWQDGRRTDLGEGQARVVNDHGMVGGFTDVQSPKPLLWLDGHRYDLRDLLPVRSCKAHPGWSEPCMDVTEMFDLNSSGQILAKGLIYTGFESRERSFLLTPTTARADLALTHTVSAVEPGPGSTVTWTSTVTNNGPDTATDVQMKVVVPQGLTGATCETLRGLCVAVAGGFRNTVKALPPGQSATVEVSATIPAATADGTELLSRADVFSVAVADSKAADNVAEVTSTVRQALNHTSRNWPDPVRVGASSYESEVVLTNRGNKEMPITLVQTEGPFAQVNDCPAKLAVGEHCTTKVRFVPVQVGEASGKLTFTTDGTGPAYTVTLTGRGIEANAKPVLVAPAAPLRATVGVPFTLRVDFTDADATDTHTAQIEWLEAPVDVTVTPTPGGGGGTVTGTKTFTEPVTDGGIMVLVKDSKGDIGELYLPIVVEAAPTGNTAPVVSAGADVELTTGETLRRTVSFSDPGSTAWSASVDYGDGSGPAPVTVTGKEITLEHRWAGAGTYPVIVTVRDEGGLQTSATFTATVTAAQTPNTAPRVELTGLVVLKEGTVWKGGVSFEDADSTAWSASVDYGDGTGPQALPLEGRTARLEHAFTDDGTPTVTVTVSDDKGATGTATATLDVANLAPKVALKEPAVDTIVAIGTPIELTATFADPGSADTHTATWNIGGQTLPGTLNGHDGAGTVTRSHTFTKAGRYPISVTVTDDDDATTSADTIGKEKAYVIVYNPATSLAGAGVTPSPAGSCTLNGGCAKAGPAAFSVLAGYPRKAGAPAGTLAYDAPGFSLRHSSLTVLAAADGTAILRGSGRVNGTTKVTFEVTAVDSGRPFDRTDQLRLKVWRENGELIYDNRRTGRESFVVGIVRVSG